MSVPTVDHKLFASDDVKEELVKKFNSIVKTNNFKFTNMGNDPINNFHKYTDTYTLENILLLDEGELNINTGLSFTGGYKHLMTITPDRDVDLFGFPYDSVPVQNRKLKTVGTKEYIYPFIRANIPCEVHYKILHYDPESPPTESPNEFYINNNLYFNRVFKLVQEGNPIMTGDKGSMFLPGINGTKVYSKENGRVNVPNIHFLEKDDEPRNRAYLQAEKGIDKNKTYGSTEAAGGGTEIDDHYLPELGNEWFFLKSEAFKYSDVLENDPHDPLDNVINGDAIPDRGNGYFRYRIRLDDKVYQDESYVCSCDHKHLYTKYYDTDDDGVKLQFTTRIPFPRELLLSSDLDNPNNNIIGKYNPKTHFLKYFNRTTGVTDHTSDGILVDTYYQCDRYKFKTDNLKIGLTGTTISDSDNTNLPVHLTDNNKNMFISTVNAEFAFGYDLGNNTQEGFGNGITSFGYRVAGLKVLDFNAGPVDSTTTTYNTDNIIIRWDYSKNIEVSDDTDWDTVFSINTDVEDRVLQLINSRAEIYFEVNNGKRLYIHELDIGTSNAYANNYIDIQIYNKITDKIVFSRLVYLENQTAQTVKIGFYGNPGTNYELRFMDIYHKPGFDNKVAVRNIVYLEMDDHRPKYTFSFKHVDDKYNGLQYLPDTIKVTRKSNPAMSNLLQNFIERYQNEQVEILKGISLDTTEYASNSEKDLRKTMAKYLYCTHDEYDNTNLNIDKTAINVCRDFTKEIQEYTLQNNANYTINGNNYVNYKNYLTTICSGKIPDPNDPGNPLINDYNIMNNVLGVNDLYVAINNRRPAYESNGTTIYNDDSVVTMTFDNLNSYDDLNGYGANDYYNISYDQNMQVSGDTTWDNEFYINRGEANHQRVVKLLFSNVDYYTDMSDDSVSTTIKKLDIIFTPKTSNLKLFSLPSFEIVDSEWPLDYMNIDIQLIKLTRVTNGEETETVEIEQIVDTISKAVGRYKIESVFFDYIGDSESTYIVRILFDKAKNSGLTNQDTLAIRNLQYVLSDDIPVLNTSLPYATYFADTISESRLNTLKNICGCLLPTELMTTIREELFQDASIKWGQYCWLDQCVNSDFLNTFMSTQIEAVPCPTELDVQNCNISTSITIGSEGELNTDLGTVSQKCNNLIDTGGDTGGDTGDTDDKSVTTLINEFINEPKNVPILILIGGVLLILIIVIAVTASKKSKGKMQQIQQMQQMQQVQQPSNYMWT